eukprot:5662762-Amphidinium_carterae.1
MVKLDLSNIIRFYGPLVRRVFNVSEYLSNRTCATATKGDLAVIAPFSAPTSSDQRDVAKVCLGALVPSTSHNVRAIKLPTYTALASQETPNHKRRDTQSVTSNVSLEPFGCRLGV